MINFGTVHPGSILYVPFETFAGATGAPITMTGFSTADIKIFRDGSTTERASTSGFVLLDTDGTDFDGITGIQGFSVDLADNTTANFYQAGGKYFIVISTVTVDSQPMSFVAATFRIAYESAFMSTFIATLSSQTSFTLSAGPAENDALKGMQCIVQNIASGIQKCIVIVSAYTGATKTVALVAAPTFTIAAQDNFCAMFLAPLQPTTPGRTLAADSAGSVVVGTNGLVDTSIASSALTAIGGAPWDTARASHTTPGTYGAGVSTTYQIRKNVALAAFEFVMSDSVTHIPTAGLTVTATRSIDGGAFAACANAVSGVSSGIYKIDLAASDLNGNVITFRFTAAAADDRIIAVVTQTA